MIGFCTFRFHSKTGLRGERGINALYYNQVESTTSETLGGTLYGGTRPRYTHPKLKLRKPKKIKRPGGLRMQDTNVVPTIIRHVFYGVCLNGIR